MKSKEEIMNLKSSSKDEIVSKILDLKKNLMNLRFQNAGSTLKDFSLIKKTKKNIARLKGFLTNNTIVNKNK